MGRALLNFARLALGPFIGAALLVALLQPLYLASLAALHALPADRIAAHITDAFVQGVLSDDGNPRGLFWKGGEQLTECISFGVGLTAHESAWQSAIASAYPQFSDTHACEGLHRAVTGRDTGWRAYFRYWHGYRVVLAPLSAALPIWTIKLFNMAMVIAACALLWRTLRARCGETVAGLFLITFICLSDVLFIWRTSTHALSLAFILIGACLFDAALRRPWRPAALIVLAAAFGSAFNFIDFLINPPMMPMLLAFFVLLSERRDAGLLAVAVVLAWFGGYAETWMAKWAIAYLTMPDPAAVIADVRATVALRTVGALNGIVLLPLAATVRCVLRALSRVGVIVPIVAAIAVARYAATVARIDWRRALWLASPVLVVVVWFEALSSHSQQHLTVSARSAAVALAIVLSAVVMALPRRPSPRELWERLSSSLRRSRSAG